ncbi:MAG: DUF1491 family protein [Alphaproteobacteria bacterium]
MEPRIKTEHWVHAHLRRCAIEAVPAFVIRHGDNERGMVLLKINTLGDGCKVLIQARDISGKLGWLAALNGDLVAEADADSYIERQVRNDPDLWVVEIEDREGRRWFDGEEI